MKKNILSTIFFFILMISMLSCAKSPEGIYELTEGDCQQFLELKNLSRLKDLSASKGKYMAVLKSSRGQDNEIVGDFIENTLIAKVGEDPIYFFVNKNRVLLLYGSKRCIFQRVKK